MQFGVIFDWDGVIIDSEALHRRSWEQFAEEIGTTLPPGAFETSFGMRNAQIIPEVFHWAELGDHQRIEAMGERKEALYRDLVRAEGITPLPGVAELFAQLKEAGIPIALGSSTPRKNIEAVIQVTGLDEIFLTIVASEDVRRGKPDPEVFLRCAERLGLSPGECVVVEDAPVGIKAARKGGMKVLAVATTHAAEKLSEADLVLPGLEAATLTTFEQLFS